MKKLLVLMMALALMAFALPALAQTIEQNDINNNGAAVGNSIGTGNQQTNQFLNATGGDSSDAVFNNSTGVAVGNLSGNTDDNSSSTFMNKSNLTVSGNLSGNTVDSSTGLVNKSFIGVFDSGNGNVSGNVVVGLNATLDGSLNGNNFYFGNMINAWTDQHRYEHESDHQMHFPLTFAGSTDAIIYMPISNTHLEQSNTGIVAGNYAGAVNTGANQVNLDGAAVSGMFALNTNLGGVATNQALLNAVTAFSAPAP